MFSDGTDRCGINALHVHNLMKARGGVQARLPEQFIELMENAWQADPAVRPETSEVHNELRDMYMHQVRVNGGQAARGGGGGQRPRPRPRPGNHWGRKDSERGGASATSRHAFD